MPKNWKNLGDSSFRVEDSYEVAPDDFERVLGAALQAGDFSRALGVLDAAPRAMKKEPELMLMRATVLISLGEEVEALRLLREVEKKAPHLIQVYLPLATVYIDHNWYAHALQSAQHALSEPDLDEERRASLEEIIQEATEYIQQQADVSGLPFETMNRACIFNEKALMAMEENRLPEADHYTREAIKLIPNWNVPHNNRARALFYTGRTAEAIAVSEAVLARDANNIFALRSLITFHYGLHQMEQAQQYANRLKEFVPKTAIDSVEVDEVISALALMEDTPALWDIAKQYLASPDYYLYGRSWYCLAVAVVRSGKWKEALRLVKKIPEEEQSAVGQELLDELQKVARQANPSLTWMPPAYPAVDMLLHPKILLEWEALLTNFIGDMTPAQRRKIDNFFQRYPFVLAALKRMLWDKDSHPLVMEILAELGLPETDAEIMRFIQSQSGTKEARSQAILRLVQTGRYTGPKIIKLWFEDQQEWRDVEVNTQQIGDVENKAQPKTMAFIEKAYKAKDPQEAIALLRKAVELEPTSPMALFNLGVVLAQNGATEEGEELIYRSVKVDPTYTYGQASIALTKANRGHEQEALEHLDAVTKAEVIAPDTAILANLAWFQLAFDKNDLKTARERFEMAAQIDPEYHLLESYEKMLNQAELLEKGFGSLFEYQRKSTQRAHQKLLKTPLTAEMTLRACLETYTLDMLVGTARLLEAPTYGKKANLVSLLSGMLLDEYHLHRILFEILNEKEREALKWMLEADGVRPWEDFARRYGDDIEESTIWRHHEPKSTTGRLRIVGLLYSGNLEGRQVAFIPAEIRPLLRKQLEAA